MKKVLAGLGISLILVNVSFASNDERDLFANDTEYVCSELTSTSQEIMSARLRGVSIVELMKLTGKGDDSASRLLKSIIKGAYSEPAYTDENDKKIAIREFGVKIYLVCMENYGKKSNN